MARSMRSLPSDFPPEAVTAIVDTREQLPLDLSPLSMTTGTLSTGDYSIKGLTDHVAIERKSLSDLLNCLGGERERFEKELQRLRAYPVRAVVCECNWADLERGDWRSKITPAAATGSVLGWIGQGIPFLFAGDRRGATDAVRRLLYITARRRWREARAFVKAVEQVATEGVAI